VRPDHTRGAARRRPVRRRRRRPRSSRAFRCARVPPSAL